MLETMKFPEKQVAIHVHGSQSGFDGTCDAKSLVKEAVARNMRAVQLSDHGTLTGVFEFNNLARENGIIPIVGYEGYCTKDLGGGVTQKSHINLMACNNEGFRAISKALTQANKNIDSYGAPQMDLDIMKKNFGKGSIGHGNVIATTACMNGYVNVGILSPFTLNKKIERLKSKQVKYRNSATCPEYDKIGERLSEIGELLSENRSAKEVADRASKKSFVKKEKALKAAEGTAEYETLKKALEAEKKEAEDAKTLKETLTTKIATLSKERTELTAKMKDLTTEFDKWQEIEEQIKDMEAAIVDNDTLKDNAKADLLELQEIFGEGNIYVELQYHGIPEEEYCMPIIAEIAKMCNIPVIAANDAHFIKNTEDARLKRQILRSLRWNKWEEETVGDDQLYLKTDEEIAEALLEILPIDTVQEAINNTQVIADRCDWEFSKEPHYPKYVSSIKGETAEAAIRRIATENIKWRFPNPADWTEEYQKRLDYELDIICSMGYADYHLIVQDFLNIGRKMGHMPADRFNIMAENIEKWSIETLVEYIEEDQSEVGLTIGPGRGSAVGSIVCYLLGITSIDPLKYGLLFERFLNPERISMPDIDSDFASEVRELVLEYVKKKYGQNAVCCIMTKGTQAAKNSIRNCARLLGSKLYNDTTTFLSLGDRIAKDIPEAPGTKFNSVMQVIYNGHSFESMEALEKAYEGGALKADHMPTDDEVQKVLLIDNLKSKYKDDANAMTIINNAVLVEGTFTHYGMHAAGVIISDNEDISDHIPLMWDTKNNVWKSQCDMNEAEALGLLKMDFLGLKNLSVITDCLRLIRKNHGISIDIEQVPIDINVLKNIYQTGLTNSVFQFESGGMKQMLRQFKPDTIEDILLLNAAYRPGPMQYLPKIVNVKQKREKLTYLIPELEPILSNTYGSIIYQEQVMRIFQDLAGYTLGGADMVRRYMSKKKNDKLAEEREAFINGDPKRGICGCVANGISAENANELFDQMMDFAAYAFNKSHACAYAFVSYYTAWLKYNYPTEYLCAVMNNVPLTKIPGLLEDCKKFGIKVLPPDINKSQNGFSIHNGEILFGLGSIKHVGDSAISIITERNNNGAFTSFKDYILRGHVKKDSTESLILAGALDCFCDNRLAMKKVIPDLLTYVKKMNDKNVAIEKKQEEIADLEANTKNKETKEYVKKLNSLNKSIESAKNALVEAKENFEKILVPAIPEDKKERLASEKELLGVYVSSHPLDEYPSSEKLGAVSIADLTVAKNVKVFGILKNVRKTTRKSDGMPMAFFKLEDRSGEIDIKCFTKTYQEYGLNVEEDAVVIITGSCFEEESFFEDDEMVKNITASKIEIVKPVRETLLIHVTNIKEWTEDVYPKLEAYKSSDGYPLVVHFRDNNTLQKVKFLVNADFLANKVGISVSVMS